MSVKNVAPAVGKCAAVFIVLFAFVIAAARAESSAEAMGHCKIDLFKNNDAIGPSRKQEYIRACMQSRGFLARSEEGFCSDAEWLFCYDRKAENGAFDRLRKALGW